MSSRHNVVWTPSLHPRDLRGRFDKSSAARSARRDGRRAATPDAARQRRQLETRAALRLARGVAVGGLTAAAGYHSGSKGHVAAGAGRVALAVAEGQHNIHSAKRVTSKNFSRLSDADQKAELNRRRRTSARFGAAGLASDAALTYSTGKLVRNKVGATRSNRLADANFTYMKGRADQRLAAAKEAKRFYQRTPQADPFSKYQGPVPSRVKAAGVKGASKGVYNIASGHVTGANPAKSSFVSRAANKVAQSPRVQRAAANVAVKAASAAQHKANAPKVKRRRA
jgi:hypothetical protein